MLFREFGFVLAITVTISSFVALTLGPMIASRLTDLEKPARLIEFCGIAPLGRLAQSVYVRVLDWALAVPLVVLSVCAVTIAGAWVTYQMLGQELVPQEDRGVVTIWIQAPDGVGLPFTDRQVEQIEQILHPFVEDGSVSSIFSIAGRYDTNRGYIEAQLQPWGHRSRSENEITLQLRDALSSIPGAMVRISSPNSLSLRDGGAGLTFALTGSEYGQLAEVAESFAQVVEREIPQLEDLRVEYRATQPQLSIRIDRQRAMDLGVAINDLSVTVQVLVDGTEVAEMSVADETIPIILESAQGSVDNPSDLGNLYVSSTDGRLVPISQLISFTEESVAGELDRHGQRRAIEISANSSAGFTLKQAVEAITALAARELPGNVGVVFLGEAATLDETSREIAITYAIALVVVFLVLVAQFESLTSATVVLLTVPMGVCAAVFALALTGTTINIYSQIGVLLLIGIMAKNAILMVEFADQLRDRGATVLEAAREASIVRLRPIAMTMASTILAGLPLILGSGPGVESRAAIGWVVFGGLGIAAVFTLCLTPVIYSLVAGLAKPRAHEGERLRTELAMAENARRDQLPGE
jgi:multidrug efflux pump subunit AcrB